MKLQPKNLKWLHALAEHGILNRTRRYGGLPCRAMRMGLTEWVWRSKATGQMMPEGFWPNPSAFDDFDIVGERLTAKGAEVLAEPEAAS